MAHYSNAYTKQYRKIKQTVSLSILIILGFTANGQSVPKEDAITVSENYMHHATGKTQRIVKEDEIYAKDTKCLYHFIFDDSSWCITSADMQTDPILAFGLTDGFSPLPDVLSEIIERQYWALGGCLAFVIVMLFGLFAEHRTFSHSLCFLLLLFSTDY